VTAAQDMRGLRDHWVTTGRREPIVLDRGAEAWLLAIATVALVALGTVMVFNTSFFHANERFGDPYLFIRRHLVAVAIGTLGLVVARRVPTRVIRRFTYPLLALLVVALVAVLVPGIGLTRGGATRWLPVGPLTVQPSELVKLAVVLYLAHSLAKKGERIRVFATGYLPHLVIVGGIALLVVLEPDYGTAVLLSAVLFLMLVAAGARASHLAGTVALALPLLVVGAMSAEYRMRRILSFLDPWQDAQASGFQLVQSLIAFGSGGLFGVGLGAGQQKMFYLPGAHTDFVFSVIGEELGLVGALSVLVAFAVLAVGGIRIAWRHPDPFASHLALGLTTTIVLQAVVNMGVAVGLLPTKGLALPFLSYGGSALIVTLIQVGILLSIAREARLGLGVSSPELSTASLGGRGGRVYVPGRGSALGLAVES
jgi:cell division protein FtsW